MNGNEPVVEIRISPQRADELMNRLIDDDEFRAQLTRSPRDALSEYGIVVPSELLPDEVELPSSEELRQARDRVDVEDYPRFGEDAYMGKFSPIWICMAWFRKFIRLPRN
jgi:putative modified peptide